MKVMLAIVWLVGIARADVPVPEAKPDKSAVEAGDANLEPTGRGSVTATFAVGGGMTIGLGVAGSVGRGGSGSFRIGRSATPHTVITLELAGVALFHAVKTTNPDGSPGKTTLKTNQDSNLMIGGQYFVSSALWFRGAAGFGVYKTEEVGPGITLVGPAGLFGAGFDLIRRRHVALGFEMMSISMINRDGILSSNGFMLDLSVD